MYTVESLRQINPAYDMQYRVTQSDVDMVNKYVKAIVDSRGDTKIQVGDIVELTTAHGDYYCNAHIETYDEEADRWSTCEQPYTPFIYFNNKGSLRCNTSEGAWTALPNALKYIGKRTKAFCDFGHNGPCGGGAVHFEAEVSVWEYKEENPRYGDYTTKDWDRFYVYYNADKPKNTHCCEDYKWSVSHQTMPHLSFTAQKDYDAWLRTIRGVTFEGNLPNQTVVFGYKEKRHLIDKEAWLQLDLPKDTRQCNGINLVKVEYDAANHLINVYAFTNAGTLDRLKYKPYELARGRDLT